MKHKHIKNFDCLDFKSKIQGKIYNETKKMTHQEEIDYYIKKARNGFFNESRKQILLHVELKPPKLKINGNMKIQVQE